MLQNPYIVIPLLTWIIAQSIKFLVAAARGRFDLKYFYTSGGMPSAHSAVVAALATTALLVDGSASHLFGLTAVVAAIVMYDSFGVRRSTGEQATALNRLLDSEQARLKVPVPADRLREVLGHTPLEVAAGAALGGLMGSLFNADKLSAQINWLTASPHKLETIIYFGLSLAVILAGLVTYWLLRRRYARSAAIRDFGRQVLVASEVIGWPGLILAFGQYETVPYLSWRLWPQLLVLGLIVWSAVIGARFGRALPQALAAERDAERKRKWFEMGQRRKKRRK